MTVEHFIQQLNLLAPSDGALVESVREFEGLDVDEVRLMFEYGLTSEYDPATSVISQIITATNVLQLGVSDFNFLQDYRQGAFCKHIDGDAFLLESDEIVVLSGDRFKCSIRSVDAFLEGVLIYYEATILFAYNRDTFSIGKFENDVERKLKDRSAINYFTEKLRDRF